MGRVDDSGNCNAKCPYCGGKCKWLEDHLKLDGVRHQCKNSDQHVWD